MADILVSGAGIAGLTLAHRLSTGGHDVTVVDPAPALPTTGQAVDLRGAGRRVVERLGAGDAVRRRLLDQDGIAWVDEHDEVRATMPVDAFGGEGIVSEYEILRGDLVRVLADLPNRTVTVRHGHRVTELDDRGDRVSITFADGTAERYDLVVGADGSASGVRRLAFGDRGVRRLGLVTAWFDAPQATCGDSGRWFRMFHAPGGRVASVRPAHDTTAVQASLWVRVDPHGAAATASARRAAVRAAFSDVGWRVPRLLDAYDASDDVATADIVTVHLPRWSSGRVVLVGDAAASPSPLTGLGTTVALVQAEVLAHMLATHDHHVAAFDAYERWCRPYVTAAQRLPPGGVDGFAPRSAFAIHAHLLTLRSMTRWPMRAVLLRQFDKAADIALPGE